ncbi:MULTISPECIES: protein kinase family protein [unclassified Nocardiopsis]|uniref:protein kinase family protein n=1 Tax=unclassified Nocardiopsis TaxID=2649073 RepID=UPI00135CF424|nr:MULTISPECIES: protein kinase family protein [unclassified Nocardiopsis]
MSTFLIEPGAKLANRYRLDQVVSETGGATRWKATDETLARPVAVWTFAEGFPRTSEVVRAARATSRIPDARVTQVFDADDSSPVPYVVEEWVIGSSLADLVAQGPMEPERAAGLVAEAAEAIAAAHAGGLHHLCLTPSKLMWSSGGAVKVTGIGVDAALLGAATANPAADDARGLGNLLYAALTGHWPGGPQSGLPAAPQGPAGPYPPHHIRQGINETLGTITTRAALPQLAGQTVPGGPITSPADFCAAMAEVPRLIPLPVAPAESTPPPEPGTSRRTGEFDSTGNGRSGYDRDSGPHRGARASAARGGTGPQRGSGVRTASAQRGAGPDGGRGHSAPSRMDRRAERTQPSARKILIGALATVLFAVVVVGAWTVGANMRDADDPAVPSGDTSDDVSGGGSSEDLVPLDVTGARGFDPFGDNDEHSDKAGNAIDGDPATVWNTEGYKDPLPNLKEGVGLLLELDSGREVHAVDLDMPAHDYAVQIRVGDSDSVSDQASLDASLPVAAERTVSGSTTVEIEGGATGSYVLIWFTDLPNVDGDWRGTVNGVEVLGIT